MAEAVIDELRRLGAEVTEDDAAVGVPEAGCNTIVGRFAPTTTGTPIMFCAHLDTVPLLDTVVVVQDGEYLTNRNAAILGGDDKAAVAVMLHAMDRIVAEGIPHAGIEIVFTACEEIGLRGAAYFDPSVLQAECGFVFDHTGEIGGIVTSSPTCMGMDATFRGTAAHAGIQPEMGRNAITAATHAVSRMPLGRIDAVTTANVGTVHGGSANNVVAEECTVTMEARSRDPEALGAHITTMLDACMGAATEAECDLEWAMHKHFTGYVLAEDYPPVAMARAAIEDVGITPHLVSSGGGSDVNALLLKAFPCVNLCNGMVDVHTPTERIRTRDLGTMVGVTLAIVARATA